ncbi:hypothetical protein VTL71DRAFT_14040 [Oculimacula yallundae]|uniref:Uncharacterized protein n=1 Tax=Oculimacula yallundae TaxID=86028 RepID=A0ABR4CPN7_9HELO
MGLSVPQSKSTLSSEAARTPPPQNDSRKSSPRALAILSRRSTLIPNPLSAVAGDLPDAASHRLLRLYMDRVTPLLISLPKDLPNPFLQDVIPLAFSDTLIMNAILNVGGFELDMDASSGEIETKRLKCYGAAINELKVALTEWSTGVRHDPMRLLLATLLLCLHECLRGNEGGTLLGHLRACRFFAQEVLTAQREGYSSDLTGTLLENYAYWEMCTNFSLLIGPDDLGAACYFSAVHFNDLRHYRTFGSYFGESSALYQSIPFISQLAVDRRAELTLRCDRGCEESFLAFKRKLEHWRDDVAVTISPPGKGESAHRYSIIAGDIVRNAALIFLYSSYYQDPTYVQTLAHPIVDEAIDMLRTVIHTPWMNTLFWPMVVLGTYAVTPLQQQRILAFWPEGIPLVVRAVKMLQWVWNRDSDAYGLEGLAKVIKDHDAHIVFG